MMKLTLLALVAVGLTAYVQGHGRLWEPPNRSSLWRMAEFKHLDPPPNWTDNELFCGGVGVQHGQNGGKCGACGDPWHFPQPRANEIGGTYYRGIITRDYQSGQTIDVDVWLTSAHLGYFQMRLCDSVREGVPEDESCFRHTLQLADGSGTDYPIRGYDGHYTYKVKLPQGVSCDHCVLQWHYHTGNTWGDCGNGTGAIGCGPQETFRGCSDIRIR